MVNLGSWFLASAAVSVSDQAERSDGIPERRHEVFGVGHSLELFGEDSVAVGVVENSRITLFLWYLSWLRLFSLAVFVVLLVMNGVYSGVSVPIPFRNSRSHWCDM